MANLNSLKYRLVSACLKVLPRYYYPQVILYHSIGTHEECRSSSVDCAEQSVFSAHMDYLLRAGFYFASLDEIAQFVKGEMSLPKKTIAVTFDDGFQDNFKYAFPVLRERNIKATIFINTAFIGKALPYRDTFWQPSSTENQEIISQFLSWEEIEIMNAQGIDFDPHTHTHVNLTEVSELQAEEEIGISKEIIEKRLGRKAKHFCYPHGLYNNAILKIVEKYGFDAGWAVANKNLVRGLNIYSLPRSCIGNSPLNRFQFVISPYYKWL